MDQRSFDTLARTLATPRSRRGVLAGVAGLGAALLGTRAAAQSDCPIPGQTRNRKGQCLCPPGTDPCRGTGVCADRKRDPENCGTCGTICPPSAVCRKGKCACPAGTATCDHACADLQTDASNCGACGRVCPPDGVCYLGDCVTAACLAAGCGTCGLCVTSVDTGLVCADGFLSISCQESCETAADCPEEGSICVSSENGLVNGFCVQSGTRRCATVLGAVCPI